MTFLYIAIIAMLCFSKLKKILCAHDLSYYYIISLFILKVFKTIIIYTYNGETDSAHHIIISIARE